MLRLGQQTELVFVEALVVLLPLGWLTDRHHLHRCHFVLGAVGGPVGGIGGDDVGTRFGKWKVV